MADAITPQAFRARFPAFAGVPDATIAGALAEAGPRVGRPGRRRMPSSGGCSTPPIP